MIRAAWLTYRIHRFEATLSTLLLVAFAIWVWMASSQLTDLDIPGTCWPRDENGNFAQPVCESLMERFWSIEGQETEPKVAREATVPASADFRRIPGGRAWCNACCAAFKVEAGTTPTVCPQGHPPQNATEKTEAEAVTA